MSLQDWFRALKIRRRRLADQRSDRHETEIAKRLRELLDTSRLIPPESTPHENPPTTMKAKHVAITTEQHRDYESKSTTCRV